MPWRWWSRRRAGSSPGREADGVRSFLGIPFAKPPVGARRFAAPEPAEPWAGVRDAGAFGASAPQLPIDAAAPGHGRRRAWTRTACT